MPNYQNSKIYKIVDKNNLIYIGSTTQDLRERFWSHRKINNNCKTKKMDRDSLKIELILDFPCNSKKELWDKEKEYVNELECINRIVPNQTRKEYYHKNVDKIKIQQKITYQKHKEKRKEEKRNWYASLSESDKKEYLEKRKEKIVCECGELTNKKGISRHKKSKKHINSL
tara:strand:+ start:98 stop:610 length:513 start_codon:yes stop_codon:yes gene_type:complete